jgi:hypothetical protein
MSEKQGTFYQRFDQVVLLSVTELADFLEQVMSTALWCLPRANQQFDDRWL